MAFCEGSHHRHHLDWKIEDKCFLFELSMDDSVFYTVSRMARGKTPFRNWNSLASGYLPTLRPALGGHARPCPHVGASNESGKLSISARGNLRGATHVRRV